MRIRLSPDLIKELTKIKRKNYILAGRIKKQLSLFTSNPKHQSLRVHKLTGELQGMWSISITRDIRMLYILRDHNDAYFFDIGTHDQVYKK